MSGNEWNAFQKEHAGKGLSRTEMSALYKASKSSNSGGSSSSSSSTTRGASSYSSSSSSSTSSSNRAPSSWNEYQHANAGQGLSRAEISAGYHAQSQSTSATRPAAPACSDLWEDEDYDDPFASLGFSLPVASSRSTTATPAVTRAMPTTPAPAARSPVQAPPPAKPTPATPLPPVVSAAPISSAPPSNPWNAFERAHAGCGLTKRQISLLYQASQHKNTTPASAGSSSRLTRPGSSSSPPSRPRQKNEFNEFRKQFKKDNPDEKLPIAQIAGLYRLQKGQAHGKDQRTAAGEATATEAARAQHRQFLEDFMLEIALIHEQPSENAPLSEQEEWTQLAQLLEAEEGNFNRQSFVNAHEFEFALTLSSENAEAHARTMSSLSECNLVELPRLLLPMDNKSRIGSGGFGTVYSSMLDGSTPVAVKVINGGDAHAKTQFKQELLAMMRASAHGNVLRVLGYTMIPPQEGGHPSYAIVMELMSGGDLAFALHRDKRVELSQSDKLRVLLQVIQAIEYIHSQGITHRDIKPHNVLLCSDLMVAKLADFGLAGFKNTALSMGTSSGSQVVMGLTPAYAAPEVFQGKLAHRDTDGWKKSDMFSFTVLLAEVLVGEKPWDCDPRRFITNAVCMRAQRPFQPEKIVLLGSASDNKMLQSLVLDGWHQDPGKRPSAKMMRQRLEQIIASTAKTQAQGQATGTATGSVGKARPNPRASSPRGVDAWFASSSMSTTTHSTFHDGDEFFEACGS